MSKNYPQEPCAVYGGTSLLNAARKSLDDGVDVALFGIPFHGGTSGIEGSRHAPEQIRQMSRNIRGLNLSTKVTPFELCRIADIGNAPSNPAEIPKSIDAITNYCKEVCATGALPLAVGGDHTIALPMLRALKDQHGPINVVHFDAHPDTWDTFSDDFSGRYNSGTPFRRAFEEGLTDPSKHIMIGIRGTMINTPEFLEGYEWAEQQGMTVLWMDECFELGAKGILEKIRNVIGDLPFYLSIDIDGIDPLDMPGTGSPEPGGLRIREMQVILRGLRGMNLIGADINEVNPLLDASGMTAFHAAHLLFEILCLAAEKKGAV